VSRQANHEWLKFKLTRLTVKVHFLYSMMVTAFS
jgi:hypothetical protein